MGLFDLEKLFDFSGDGKTDIGEEFIAFMMFEEMQQGNREDDPDAVDDSDELGEGVEWDDNDHNV